MRDTKENQTCFFVSDLHGHVDRYEKLFKKIEEERPLALFIGGDILPAALLSLTASAHTYADFINDVIGVGLKKLQNILVDDYPEIFVILGNDDSKFYESAVLDLAARGVWKYAHNRDIKLGTFTVYGYSYVPPSPFLLKDWERYDVSRYVDPGCVSPEEGFRSVPASEYEKKWSTIQDDLNDLTKDEDLSKSIFLFHSPPYKTPLDRAALDGKMIDFAPLDVHVGSIAIQRFIKKRQPRITLHGHIHESTRITGSWRCNIGKTRCFNAAHDGKELALIKFDPNHPDKAERELV